MVKVLVVEDGDIGRLGRAAALESCGHQVTAVRWREVDELLGTDIGPGSHDVVVAALPPETTSWDHYPMLGTLGAAKAALGGRVLVVGLLWGAANHNPLLRLRLEQAGVDRVTDTDAVRDADDAHRLVSDPGVGQPCRPTEDELAMAGVSGACDPDALVAWVVERLDGEQAAAYRRAFDPSCTQNACGLSRRQAHTLRVRLSALGGIRPNLLLSGGGPVRDRSLPRWNEVVAVVNQCRGWDDGSATANAGLDSGPPARFRLTA